MMDRSNFKSSLAILSLLLAPTAPLLAASSEGSGDGLAEIIVTAQKRTQNIQDVGVAITALGSDALQMIGHQDVIGLVNKVPDLQVQAYSPAQTVFNIRGVAQNDFSDGQEAPIAFYNDEVYISALGAISGQLFDLERVEVLAGPQGTLFGRNATGGLVQVVSAKPTKDMEGFATVTYGSFDQIATEAAISGPFTDQIRGRLAISTNNADGYYKNQVGPDEDNVRFFGVRAQIAADIADRGLLRFKAEYLKDLPEVGGGSSHHAAGFDANGNGYRLSPNENFWGPGGVGFLYPGAIAIPLAAPCAGCDANGYRATSTSPFLGGQDFRGLFERSYLSLTAHYEHNLGFGKITSISNYQHLTKNFNEDLDNSPNAIFNILTFQKLQQYSEELRMSGDSGSLNWVFGVYGMKISSEQSAAAEIPIFFAGTLSESVLDTKTLAGFAQLEYRFNDIFSAIVGGRYTVDWKTDNYFTSINGVTDFEFNPSIYPDLAKKRFGNSSGKVELDAKPNANTLVYLSVNRGYKSGGFGFLNTCPCNAATIPFDGEVLTNYEGGFKLSSSDKRFTFNGSAFWYHYKGYQAFDIIGLSSIITNQPARVKGVELTAAARPYSSLNLSVFATHIFEAKVFNVTLPFGEVSAENQMPQTPRWSFGATAAQDFSLGSAGTLRLSTSWKYNSDQYFSTFNASDTLSHGSATGDVDLAYLPLGSHWEVRGFVNNVTDRRYLVYNSDFGTLLGMVQDVYAPPRWYGISATYRFGGPQR